MVVLALWNSRAGNSRRIPDGIPAPAQNHPESPPTQSSDFCRFRKYIGRVESAVRSHRPPGPSRGPCGKVWISSRRGEFQTTFGKFQTPLPDALGTARAPTMGATVFSQTRTKVLARLNRSLGCLRATRPRSRRPERPSGCVWKSVWNLPDGPK